jgi:hypothetical protein
VRANGNGDRLTTMTFPVVLGKGKRIFSDETPAGAFELVEHKVSTRGAVIATYIPGGKIEVGSFGEIHSAPERERERRMRDRTW